MIWPMFDLIFGSKNEVEHRSYHESPKSYVLAQENVFWAILRIHIFVVLTCGGDRKKNICMKSHKIIVYFTYCKHGAIFIKIGTATDICDVINSAIFADCFFFGGGGRNLLCFPVRSPLTLREPPFTVWSHLLSTEQRVRARSPKCSYI